ncbi:Hypothetical protein2 [Nesidiocoris tenuis]|uniref:Endonuclease n=2 Tax=Nesidiocoris tenuis TaxID=355587 RepID=A0ABN7ALK3_9HEMI|nr:Hypothetical protein2 [Nesidiocoris tenuis]
MSDKEAYPQLGSSNFANWKFRVLLLLEEKRCLSVLKPLEDGATEDKRKSFSSLDVIARSIISKCVPDRFIEYIIEAATAAEMLEALSRVFARKSTMSKLMIRKKLLTLKCSSDLQTHFVNFDGLIRELETMGTKMEQDDKICHLLMTLPTAYDNVITVLETMDSSDITIEFVKSKLLDAEMKQRQLITQGESDDGCAFHSKFVRKCWECGDSRHLRDNCPKIHRENRGNSYGNEYGVVNRVRGARGRGSASRNYRHNYPRRANMAEEVFDSNLTSDEAERNVEECTMAFVTQAEANEISISDHRQRKIESTSGQNRIKLVIDSGSTDHLVGESVLPLMTNIRELPERIHIRVANGQKLIATKKGSLKIQGERCAITLDALIVPNLTLNLLSVRKVNKQGFDVVFTGDRAFIKDKNGNIHVKCNAIGNLFVAEFTVKTEYSCAANNSNLWHLRLGHAHNQYIRKMKLPTSDEVCESCRESKSARLPFRPTSKPRSRRVGELVHCDIGGPVKTPTNQDERYFMVLVDDYSHFCTVYLLKSKSEAETHLRSYISGLRAQKGIYSSRIRMDNAAEFRTNSFRKFCRIRGIKMEYSIPYSPQMNGVSENIQKTLVAKVRCMFSDTNLPRHLWGEAIRTAAYQLNRTPSSANGGKLPALLYHGKVDLSRLKVFGSKAWAHILPRSADKFDPRARPVRMVGYNENGYRLYDPETNSIVVSRDVIFNENDYVFENETRYYSPTENDSSEQNIEEPEPEPETSKAEKPKTEKRLRKPPQKFKDYELYSSETYTAYCLLTDESPKNEEKKIAIEKELHARKKFNKNVLPDVT